ncbi:hypothetical protein FA95DRAFT_1579438 [Auriscalpium vulgare]|uniref:Uncharacterized protein n=1 Tax=Auriscalpium vulgare TaxID=40419 RepID=A0ACB8SBF4_9AGAM|nr:hypothetical protein FA95DRAFT_1579438 [Auriscalpium vulgare]
MRQKRSKAYRKLMNMYRLSFGFREPYQVLVDSETCKEAISRNHDFLAELAAVLHGTVKPMITQCSIHELYLQGKSQQPAVDLAKSFERRKCNHKEAIPGEECLSSVIGDTNKHRYVVATQSQPLRVKLRAVPGVPIVHIERSVMILEPPSDTTVRAKALSEQDAMAPSTSESVKLQAGAPPPAEPLKKRKGPKGPNPLSVKKKKIAQDAPEKRKASSHADSLGRKAISEVGLKRKREDESSPATLPQAQGGHKRKRRRKTHLGDPPISVAQ